MPIEIIDTLKQKGTSTLISYPVVENNAVKDSFCHIGNITDLTSVNTSLPYYCRSVGQIVYNNNDDQFYKITAIGSSTVLPTFQQLQIGSSAPLSGDVTGTQMSTVVHKVCGVETDKSQSVVTVNDDGMSLISKEISGQWYLTPGYVDTDGVDLTGITINSLSFAGGRTLNSYESNDYMSAMTQQYGISSIDATVNSTQGYKLSSVAFDSNSVTNVVSGQTNITNTPSISHYCDLSSQVPSIDLDYSITRAGKTKTKKHKIKIGLRVGYIVDVYFVPNSATHINNMNHVLCQSYSDFSVNVDVNTTSNPEKYVYIALPSLSGGAFNFMSSYAERNFMVGGIRGGFVKVSGPNTIPVTNNGVTIQYVVWRSLWPNTGEMDISIG